MQLPIVGSPQDDPDELRRRLALSPVPPPTPPDASSSQTGGVLISSPTNVTPVQVPSAAKSRQQADEAELNRLTAPGQESSQPGVVQYQHKHPILGTIARVGDALLGSMFPGVAVNVPGTTLHHNVLVNRQSARVANDVAQQQKEAETAQTQEATQEAPQKLQLEQNKEKLAEQLAAQPKPKEEEWDVVQGYQGPGGVPILKEKNSGQLRLADSIPGIQAVQKEPATPPHITVLGRDGKSHIMERDPKSGEYSIDRGVAPPNYAAVLPQVLGTKTTEMLGPDNVMHRYQYNGATGKFDIDMGAAPSGTAAHQIFQAGAIENLAPQLIEDINANRQILGSLSSYYKQWLAGTPVGDPRAAQLMTELMSFAAMQPALHAFRSTSALDAFEKMVGGLAKDPDATIATIQGLLKTPQAFTGMVNHKENTKPASKEDPLGIR